MSASIRSDSLLFDIPTTKSEGENALLCSDATHGFGALLDSELEQARRDPVPSPGEDQSAWSLYAVGLIHVPLPSEREVEIQFASRPLERTPAAEGETGSESWGERALPASEIPASASDSSHVGPEQILPAARSVQLQKQEQIAEIPSAELKTPRGMVGAKQAVMLLSQPQRSVETSEGEAPHLLRQGILESSSFEQPLTTGRAPVVHPRFIETPAKIEIFSLEQPQPVRIEIREMVEIAEAPPKQPLDLLESVRGHVQLLRASSPDRLEVVLRPDSRTEIYLCVSRIEGQLQVQARCDRGDFARLEGNWSLVQQSLGADGVKVESLQHGSASQGKLNDDHSDSRRREHFADRDGAGESFVAQKPKKRSATSAPRQSSSVRGWQTWA